MVSVLVLGGVRSGTPAIGGAGGTGVSEGATLSSGCSDCVPSTARFERVSSGATSVGGAGGWRPGAVRRDGARGAARARMVVRAAGVTSGLATGRSVVRLLPARALVVGLLGLAGAGRLCRGRLAGRRCWSWLDPAAGWPRQAGGFGSAAPERRGPGSWAGAGWSTTVASGGPRSAADRRSSRRRPSVGVMDAQDLVASLSGQATRATAAASTMATAARSALFVRSAEIGTLGGKKHLRGRGGRAAARLGLECEPHAGIGR